MASAAAQRPQVKRVALLLMLEFEDDEGRKVVDQYIDTNFVKPFAELGLREGVNFRLVPYVVPTKSDWDKTVGRATREIAIGNYDAAIAEGDFLAGRLRQAAPRLPIAAYLFDPVGSGFAASLARPGGTVTGVHRGVREIFVKQIDLLRRVVPDTTRIAFIGHGPQIAERGAAFEAAAEAAGLPVRQVRLNHKDKFASLPGDFEALRRDGYRCGHFNGGLDPDLDAVSALAARHRIALSFWGNPGDFFREGLLLQYRSLRDGVEARLAAAVARILRGQHPRDIPFEGPTRYQMRINLRTAARIGVKIPADVLLMADEVLR
jgi:putative ABC transport system substrate-binding protein